MFRVLLRCQSVHGIGSWEKSTCHVGRQALKNPDAELVHLFLETERRERHSRSMHPHLHLPLRESPTGGAEAIFFL